ncbi:MAG: zinc ABC transporter substrate-binding protein, partial [Kiloniellales bacterium]
MLMAVPAGRTAGPDAPHVVVSIKPVHSLVAGVM